MRVILRIVLGLVFAALVTLAFAMLHPRSALDPAWKPLAPLSISDPVTGFTDFKLRRALSSGATCRTALDTGARFEPLPDLERTTQCHIRDRVRLQSVAGISVRPFETRCQTALRLAMWVEHGIKPAARTHFDDSLREVRHASSYNCREIRTTSGASGRMSTHATAESVDINGVVLGDGRRLDLLSGWSAEDARGAFFREISQSSCRWFRVSLGPEYNRLHADHFHLQHTGWGLCR